MSSNRHLETLRSKDLFSGIAPSIYEAFRSLEVRASYPAQVTLFHGDEMAAGVFVLHAGSVRVSESPSEGESSSSRTARAGEILGVWATVGGCRYLAACTTAEACEIGYIEGSAFCTLLAEHHALAFRLVQLLSHGLSTTLDQLRDGLAKSPWNV